MEQTWVPLLKRATITASIVGPLLTLINQWPAVSGQAPLDVAACALTFMVPFCVSLVTASIVQRQMAAKLQAVSDQAERARQAAATALQEAQRERLAPPPDIATADRPVQEIEGIVSEILGNATKVNRSSIERVTFIEGLIDRVAQVETSTASLQMLCKKSDVSAQEMQQAGAKISTLVAEMVDSLKRANRLTLDLQESSESHLAGCQRISNLTDQIDSLANRIKLVAINSAIEAARLGEQGNGFQIVAQEVQNLSFETKETADMIHKEAEAFSKNVIGLQPRLDAASTSSQENMEKGQDCLSAMDDLCGLSANVSHDLAEVQRNLNETSAMVAHVIADVRQIKTNTEAAIVGSKVNMGLCSEALALLDGAAPMIRKAS